MWPAEGCTRPTIARPSVDFPQPLSPTSPSVSPGAMVSDTSSTARSLLRMVEARFGERTARRENTSGRRVDEVRDTAGNRRQSLPAPVGRERRNAGQQTLGIRMERLLEQPGQRALLHQTPAVQYAHAVADAHDDAEIVRDEQDRQQQSVAKLLDEVENLRLNRH